MLAKDIMHREVISIAHDAPVQQAVALMVERRVSGLVVVDDAGEMVGMLTEGDLLRRAEIGTEPHYSKLLTFLRGPSREARDYLRTHARLVLDLMHTPVIAVNVDTGLEEVVAAMEKYKVRRLPVLAAGVPVGMISRADLLRALLPMLTRIEPPPACTDSELANSVVAALRAQSWAPPGVTVAAADGVITLSGVVTNPDEERAVTVLVQNVAGVKDVRNELAYVDVNTGISMTGLGEIGLG